MRFRNRRQLERFLAREVLGKELATRKPPSKERRGPARDSAYRTWIRTLPSLVSGLYGCECCHFGTDGGMSQKASDYTTGPLTPAEHREYHQIGKKTFERKYRINCARIAARLNAEWREERERGAA